MNLLRALKSKLSSEPVPRKEENDIKSDDIITILEQEMKNFFPKNGHWYSSCFRQSNEINRKFLPCHLRDYVWLSKLMQKELETKSVHIPANLIKSFMINSQEFNDRRYNYELEIVRWQIEWMDNGGEHWLVPADFGGDFWMHGGNCDICFRQGVVETLTAIGMAKYVVEQGLEIYSHLWREKYMSLAFENRYNPTINNFLRKSRIEPLPALDEGHKEMWLKVRRYKYYLEHKNVLDELKLMSPDMLMSQEEIRKILVKLKVTNIQREMTIKRWKEKGAHFMSFDAREEHFNL